MRHETLRKSACRLLSDGLNQWLMLAVVLFFCQPLCAQQIAVLASSDAATSSSFNAAANATALPAQPSPHLIASAFVPNIQPLKSSESKEAAPSRRSWLILSAAGHTAATLDAYSTRRAIAMGGVESNPLIRPFAHSPAIYAALQTDPLVLNYVGYRLQRSQNKFLRRIWWVPQSVGIAASFGAAMHDLGYKPNQ